MRHNTPMSTAPSLYRRHRFPSEIISPCLLLHFCFPLSYHDVEAMMQMPETTAVQSAAAATVSDAANEADARRVEVTREQAAGSK
jgi:transposase-like protein